MLLLSTLLKTTNMSLSELLLNEFDHESVNTRKMLSRFPDEHADWKPHEKSYTLSRLASHVAELPKFLEWILQQNDLDITALTGPRPDFKNREELLAFYEGQVETGRQALQAATNESLMETWTFRAGERVVFQGTRYSAVRNWMANHQIHHRGQLSVYFRLLDVPVPGMYGPSADDRIAMEAHAAANS